MKSLTIGILGGGQLGRMTCFAAHALGHKTVIFSDYANCPASFVTNHAIIADFSDKEALKKFANSVDLITFEFENIPVESVEFIETLTEVYPSSKVLKITQNRLLEKEFLNKIGVKTADFTQIHTNQELLAGFHKFEKSILKTVMMGYDGKGQFVVKNQEDALNAWDEVLQKNLLKNSLILEKFCPFKSEISVMVSRALNGEIACYQPLTNIHKNGILDKSFYPARVSDGCKKNAMEIAIKIAQNLDLKGILAVEFFVMENEELIVNELAPRPHNSGHFSMDAAITSQFEQLIRAITNLKLGDSNYHSRGFMQNLIGNDVNNLEEFSQNQHAKIHLYGKSEAKEGRKMGHINVFE